jgi:hypothetical protein
MSPYSAVSAAYRIATTDVVLFLGTSRRLQVIDYVGEQVVPPGRYSYVFSLYDDPNGDRGLQQTVRQD